MSSLSLEFPCLMDFLSCTAPLYFPFIVAKWIWQSSYTNTDISCMSGKQGAGYESVCRLRSVIWTRVNAVLSPCWKGVKTRLGPCTLKCWCGGSGMLRLQIGGCIMRVCCAPLISELQRPNGEREINCWTHMPGVIRFPPSAFFSCEIVCLCIWLSREIDQCRQKTIAR